MIYGKDIVKKIIVINIIVYMCFGIVFSSNTFAAQKTYPYTDGCLSSYKGYDTLIENLKKNHPTWSFTILETGLDWNDVIKNETVASHGRNLIYYTNGGSWVCTTCGDALYDTGRWKCASETAVAYYMDPRNWINEENVFQFEDLAYNGEIQNIEGVKKILNSVPWASGDKITYVNTEGKTVTMEKSYAQVIMEASAEAKISPYHLAARIKQEQGAGSTASSTGAGKYTGYVGYYNFLNIKATGANVIANALKHAQSQGWNNPEKAIKGGAKFIAAEYINRGQSTLYLQKFDVDNSDGALYYHQYMQNVSAALTEGNTVKSSYASMDLLNSNLNFVIPVYKNMPQETSPSPDGIKLVTQNVKVTGNEVSVRSGKSSAYSEISKVKKDTVLLRIELALYKENGFYWDKIVLPDGRRGYIARDSITQIDDVTNANTSMILIAGGVNLRNGPGTVETKTIGTLTNGQSVTVIETGKYKNIDGHDWSRVKLASGMQGYVASEYLMDVKKTDYQVAYLTGDKVYLRSGIGKNNSVVTVLNINTKVTVIQKSAGKADEIEWDKIVTQDGLQGYIASQFLKYEEKKPTEEKPTEQKPTEEKPSEQKPAEGDKTVVVKGEDNDSFKIDGKYVITEPKTKVSTIKKKYSGAVVKSGDKALEDSKLVGTGNSATIDGKSYTIIKLGDVNGDGEIKATDYMKIKNNIMGVSKLNEYEMKAADVNKDGEIKATDYMKVKNNIMGASDINI